MAHSITIQTGTGPRNVPAVWQGTYLTVHRPPSSKSPSGLSTEPRHWAITHTASGLAACASFDGAKQSAIDLARLWDGAFAELDAANARAWRYAQSWLADVRLAQWSGTEKPLGPVLPDNPGPRDVAAAIAHAIGGGYQEPSDDDAAEQFPARETVAANRLRDGAEGLELLWRGRWYLVPSLGKVELWALDSVAETPDGRTVEPDAPDSWPRLLGVV